MSEAPNPCGPLRCHERPSNLEWTFDGKLQGEDLVGTFTMDDAMGQQITAARVAAGARGPEGVPLIAGFRKATDQGGCVIDVGGAEAIALEVPAVEAALNKTWYRAFDGAAALCEDDATVMGGVSVGAYSNIALYYSVSYLILTDGATRREPTTRVVVDLATGKHLALFGDFLRPGTEAALLTAVDTTIDAMDPAQLDAAGKTELKAAVHALIDQGNTQNNFGLNLRGLVLASPGFERPRLEGVFIPYDELTAIIAPESVGATFVPAL